jgi:hypothetical protein
MLYYSIVLINRYSSGNADVSKLSATRNKSAVQQQSQQGKEQGGREKNG